MQSIGISDIYYGKHIFNVAEKNTKHLFQEEFGLDTDQFESVMAYIRQSKEKKLRKDKKRN